MVLCLLPWRVGRASLIKLSTLRPQPIGGLNANLLFSVLGNSLTHPRVLLVDSGTRFML